MLLPLAAEQGRALGALIEKQLATPQQYPLTLRALAAACNQATSREPVVSYDDAMVASAVQGLKERRLVRFVHPSHGRSALRYRQVLEEVAALSLPELALVSLLLLRGPQTPGELRARGARLATFSSIADVEERLARLASGTPPLIDGMGRRPGQKEQRYRQLLAAAPPAGM